MQLSARSAGVAAVLAVAFASPSAAIAINGGDPAGDYARANSGGCSNGTLRAPVGAVFTNFASKQAVFNALDDQIPAWDSFAAHSPPQVLKIKGSSGVYCANEDSFRNSPTSGGLRTQMRLWASSVVTAATPTLQHQATGGCTGTWVATAGPAGGFTTGRQEFEQDFQGTANPTNGFYPLQEAYWANTHQIQQCDGTSVGSDGNVAIIQPPDDFGFSDRWFQLNENPNNPSQDPFKLADNEGVTVVRYAANWDVVGPNGSVTTGNCAQRPGNWGHLDDTYETLTGLSACANPPVGYNPPIAPLIFVRGAPDQYAQVCDSELSDTALVANNTDSNQAWKGFVRNVADRYPLARGIEVWNEPNLRKYWGGCAPNASRYGALLTRAHDAVKVDSSHPGIPVVLGSMSPTPLPPDSNSWKAYLGDVFDALADPASEFNVLGLHPYRTNDDVLAGRGFPGAAEYAVGQAHTFLSNHSAGGKPVWVTEVGVSTGLNQNNPKYVGSPQEQATVLRSIYQRLRNEAEVPVVTLYRFADPNSTETEPLGYGVVKAENNPTPFAQKVAYRCLKLTRGLGGDCP
jgi:hypothetical protein